MVAKKRRPTPIQLNSSYTKSSYPASAFEGAYEDITMSSRHTESRSPSNSMLGGSFPTLTDILLDVASPPFTRTAFMAYLSQNHCMETLEFTLDAQRYTTRYRQMESQESIKRETFYQLCGLWDRLIRNYIIPGAPRELNLPAWVRDYLLQIDSQPSPPHPSELDDASRIVFDLMNDSLLVPFLESVFHQSQRRREGRSHSKNDHTRPKSRLMFSRDSKSSSPEPGDLTDDSDFAFASGSEPMTPPTTPPLSDWAFQQSQGGLHRAVAAHSMGWKKVGAKLGLNRKSTHRPSQSSHYDSSEMPGSHHQHDMI